jgi:hypothetical protein
MSELKLRPPEGGERKTYSPRVWRPREEGFLASKTSFRMTCFLFWVI